MYYCPSRRPVTKNPVDNTYLMDYAAAVPSRTRSQRVLNLPNWLAESQPWGIVGCSLSGNGDFWGTTGGQARFDADMTPAKLANPVGYMGVIVRSSYWKSTPPESKNLGFYTPISFEHITDGSSNTLVLGEKRIQPSLYDFKEWYDDKGWTDGWDPDTLRSTHCRPAPDQDMTGSSPGRDAIGYSFGGAHSELFNAGFADASVRSVRFDIDVELLNKLGHRSDGEEMDMGAL
jgi:hypothetical protein